jgi:hypothetical protein
MQLAVHGTRDDRAVILRELHARVPEDPRVTVEEATAWAGNGRRKAIGEVRRRETSARGHAFCYVARPS